MIRIRTGAVAAFCAAFLLPAAVVGSATQPWATSNTTEQLASFAGLEPNTGYVVKYSVYHYDGDQTPYVLGVWATSNSVGIVKAHASLDELAQGYEGGINAPIYEVGTCVETLDRETVVCHDPVYVGYYPETMWYYQGG